jgi:hypothetical protein
MNNPINANHNESSKNEKEKSATKLSSLVIHTSEQQINGK